MSGKRVKCIDVKEKEKCCGCSACMNICEQQCISMLPDDEGFAYPQVNRQLCINCGLCLTRCHMTRTSQNTNSNHPYCYAAYSKDDNKSTEGSAGGIFELLCETIYDMQGIVYGVSLDDGFQTRHHRAADLETAKKFRKVKYLQSETGYSFRQAERDLKEGRIVLFTGTPCQIEGLYGYLGKNYPNLYTVDTFCHGVPSKAVFLKYLEALEEKYNSKPVSVCWKDKRDGWRPNKISVRLENGKEVVVKAIHNSMQIGFWKQLYLRPSCYQCRYGTIPRIADMSLGNFIEYEGRLLEQNHNKGLSLVVISNEKAMSLFNKISQKIIYEKADIESCRKKIMSFNETALWNENRTCFMRELKNGAGFKWLLNKYIARDLPRECDLVDLEDYIAMNKENKFSYDKSTVRNKSKGDKIWAIISNE